MKKIIFIDMDGCISAFGSVDDKVNCADFPTGSFEHQLPVIPAIEAIVRNFQDDYWEILSAAPHKQAIEEKNKWLDKYFPVDRRHFIIWKEESKADFIRIYSEIHNIPFDRMVLIDDDHSILREVEEMGVQVYHLSRLLTLGGEE